MNRFINKVVVITGAAGGIGAAAVRKFLLEGAIVYAWDTNAEKGNALQQEYVNMGFNVHFQNVNITQANDVNEAVNTIIQKAENIHVLINNAGITRDASLQKMTDEQWKQVLDVNLTGVFNCTKAISPVMIEQKYGRIINTSSIVGLFGNYGQTNYAATKAGVVAMTQTWARELGKHGITVNAVAPGFIETEMVQTIPEKVLESMRQRVPLNTLGTPEDVANVYAFLASQAARYINGSVIRVDGGLNI